jgi:uncharacterized protein with HEPN domain
MTRKPCARDLTGRASAGWGDILRHGYYKVDDEIVWNTAKDELPAMRAAILTALEQNSQQP